MKAERGYELPDVITCAAADCRSKGLGVRELNTEEGGQVVGAPNGWGVITAHQENPDGSEVEVDLFVCSPSCERRLAMTLTTPRLGIL